MVIQNSEELKLSFLHQLLLAEFYKNNSKKDNHLVRVIGEAMPNPFFDLKKFQDERD